MIDKLEAGKTYRLIDKEGYLSETDRDYIFEKHFKNYCVKIDSVTIHGQGDIDGEEAYFIITESEYEYFELVDNPPQFTLTRCQELAAEYNDSRFTVEYKQQVLESLIQLLTTGESK